MPEETRKAVTFNLFILFHEKSIENCLKRLKGYCFLNTLYHLRLAESLHAHHYSQQYQGLSNEAVVTVAWWVSRLFTYWEKQGGRRLDKQEVLVLYERVFLPEVEVLKKMLEIVRNNHELLLSYFKSKIPDGYCGDQSAAYSSPYLGACRT